jgi:hypothetical protein
VRHHLERLTARVSLLLLALALGAAPAAALHPDSISQSRVEVDGARATLELRCQIVSLLEVLPALDADGDGAVTELEVATARDAIMAYVGEHYRLVTGSDRDAEGGTPLTPEPSGVLLLPMGTELGAGWELSGVDVALAFTHDGPIDDLLVTCDLFFDTSPDHVDMGQVRWRDGEQRSFGLERRQPWVRVDPTGRGAFGWYVGRGLDAASGAWQGLVFLAALLVAAADWKRMRQAVLALTQAGLLAVIVAVEGSDLVAETLGRPGGLESLRPLLLACVALVGAYIACDPLLRPTVVRTRRLEAALGGLLLGAALGAPFVHELAREPEAVGYTGLAGLAAGVVVLPAMVLVVLGVFLGLRAEHGSPRAAADAGADAGTELEAGVEAEQETARLVPRTLARVLGGALAAVGIAAFLVQT